MDEDGGCVCDMGRGVSRSIESSTIPRLLEVTPRQQAAVAVLHRYPTVLPEEERVVNVDAEGRGKPAQQMTLRRQALQW